MSSSTDSIGFAIIGTGMIAEFHANAIALVPGAKLLGAYGNIPEQRRVFCEKHGIREYDSLEAVIEWSGAGERWCRGNRTLANVRPGDNCQRMRPTINDSARGSCPSPAGFKSVGCRES